MSDRTSAEIFSHIIVILAGDENKLKLVVAMAKKYDFIFPEELSPNAQAIVKAWESYREDDVK